MEQETQPKVHEHGKGVDIAARFETAVSELDKALAGRSLEDEVVEKSVRSWLDRHRAAFLDAI